MHQQVCPLRVEVAVWQEAKASAMGPNHDLAAASDLTWAPLWESLRQHADTARADGWHWKYKLASLQVRRLVARCCTSKEVHHTSNASSL